MYSLLSISAIPPSSALLPFTALLPSVVLLLFATNLLFIAPSACFASAVTLLTATRGQQLAPPTGTIICINATCNNCG